MEISSFDASICAVGVVRQVDVQGPMKPQCLPRVRSETLAHGSMWPRCACGMLDESTIPGTAPRPARAAEIRYRSGLKKSPLRARLRFPKHAEASRDDTH